MLHSAQDWSALVVPIHPTLSGHPTAFSGYVCNMHGVSSHKAHTGSTRGRLARWPSPETTCARPLAAGPAPPVPAGASSWFGPTPSSLVQSCDTRCRHVLWVSAVPQIYATSTALSGCLPLVSTLTEVLLLFSHPNTHSSHKPY